MRQDEILNLLESTRAILKGHFLLSSGLHTDTYIQCARLLQYPLLAERVGKSLAERFSDAGLETPPLVASPALGGIIIGHEVARALGCRHIFIEKVNGTPTLRRGFTIAKDEEFLVVEDVVTTGRSTAEVISVLKELGGFPVAVLAIIDRTSGREPKFGNIPFVALTKIDIDTFEPDNCPLCKKGIPLEKPGSRVFNENS